MAAELPFEPVYTMPIRVKGPRTLVTALEDEKELRRRKSNAVRFSHRVTFVLTLVDLQWFWLFYKIHGTDLPFEFKRFSDLPPHLLTSLWLFEKPPRATYASYDTFILEADVREDLNTA